MNQEVYIEGSSTLYQKYKDIPKEKLSYDKVFKIKNLYKTLFNKKDMHSIMFNEESNNKTIKELEKINNFWSWVFENLNDFNHLDFLEANIFFNMHETEYCFIYTNFYIENLDGQLLFTINFDDLVWFISKEYNNVLEKSKIEIENLKKFIIENKENGEIELKVYMKLEEPDIIAGIL